MRIENLELNCTTANILDKLILDCKAAGLNYFSKGYKTINGYYSVQCPYHKNGLENRPSAQFRMTDGLFYCFNCKKPHSMSDVIQYCLNVNGKSWLLKNFDSSTAVVREVPFALKPITKKKTNYIDEKELERFKGTHPYMFQRKMTPEVIEKFCIGYDKEQNCITFPNRDINGNILFIATRNVNNKFFHYPEEVDKPVYGLYELYRDIKNGIKVDKVYICESMINCLTLYGWGKHAVALNGTGSDKQIAILNKCDIRYFVLALDPDEAGKKGTEKLLAGLKHKIVEVVHLPAPKDVNDCTKEEFEALVPDKPVFT